MILTGLSHSRGTIRQPDWMDVQEMQTKVLVVDDDRDTTDLLKIILEPQSFAVITANSGEEGIELAKLWAPDVMVVDLLMPGIDGLNVVRSIRKFSSIPILIISAVNKPNIAELTLDCGGDDFLKKPFSSGVLIASVNKLARRARAEQNSQAGNGSETPPVPDCQNPL